MLRWMALLACFWCIHGSNQPNETNLMLLQILFRHGDRTPEASYVSDPNPAAFWHEGLNALTKLGKQQLYAHGKFLRSMYNNFITTCPNEVFVNSSAVEYVLSSAEVHMASLYAPTPSWQFVGNLKWQPIPIHYTALENDKYLSTQPKCPRADAEREKYFQSPHFQKEASEYSPLFEKLQRLQGKVNEPYNYVEIMLTIDTLWIEKRYGLVIPTWAEQQWDDILKCSEFLGDSLHKTPEIIRLQAGPLLGDIIQNMLLKISGKTPEMKVRSFATHDGKILEFLQAFKLYNRIHPPYCATVLIELHELQPDGNFAVRMLYLNSSEPENGYQTPHLMEIEGCSEFCPLEYFAEYAKPLIPEDWEKECQLT